MANRVSIPAVVCAVVFVTANYCGVVPQSDAGEVASAPTTVSGKLRRNMLFTEGWRFHLGDDAKAKDLAFDDSAWRTLDLPHDWSVEGAFDPKLASCTAFLPCGIGWYRKTFTVAADAKDKLISIRFDGVMNHCQVWCNGKLVGGRPYGYSSFTCDLTPAIRFGDKNVIAVRVDHHQYADSRWYAGSGIYRNVYFNVTGKVHVEDNSVVVTTSNVSELTAEVEVRTIVKNDSLAAAEIDLVTFFEDEHGLVEDSDDQRGLVPAGGQRQFTTATVRGSERLTHWSPKDPRMCCVETIVMVKKMLVVADRCKTPFGIRTFAFDPAKGFSLTGQPMKLKGVCLHHDAGALGAAVPIQVWQRRFKLLKAAGCNAIRCSHNPPAPEFLDLCDRMGFVVMDEAFDEWTRGKKKWIVGHNIGPPGTEGYHSDFDHWADRDIRDMVLRDRNHPSVILWSIGNEIDYQNDPYPPNSPELPPIAERLIKDVKAVDTTRPVTAACAAPETNLFKKLLDVEGYNYMERLYAADHAAHPNRVIYGSENFHTPSAWEAVAENDYIAGQFLWTGIDYLGEARVWPSHAARSGLLDLAGIPKYQYYLRKALWSDEPMVYLSTFRMGRGRIGRTPLARADWSFTNCFTNCDRVELFHDGKSLGSKPLTPEHVMNWRLDFTGGVLKAVGTKGKRQVTFELKKAGPAAKLVLRPDVERLAADGRDLAQIELNVTDKDGTLAPDAGNPIACSITGPARIIGLENGDTASTENYNTKSRRAFQGRLMIYVQSLKTAGEAKLTVSSPGLEAASVTLPVR
jgi:beta-galactosidase